MTRPTLTHNHNPVTYLLVEAGVGARVEQVLPPDALDVEASEVAVIALERLEALRRHGPATRRELQQARALALIQRLAHSVPEPADDAVPLPEPRVLAQVLRVPPPVRHVDRWAVGCLGGRWGSWR